MIRLHIMKNRGVRKNLIRLLTVLTCCAALSACALPASRQQLKRAIVQTAVADSLVGTHAAATLTAFIPSPTSTPLPTTPVPDTPTPSLTPLPTRTPTMAGVWLTLKENTYCQTEPGSASDAQILLNSGKMVEIMARDPLDAYYYIRDPNNFSQYCWIPAVNTTITGNLSRLPEITAEALYAPIATQAGTPVMNDFAVSFDKIIKCKDSYGIVLYVENTGSLIWRSIRVILTDNTTRRSFLHDSNLFRGTKDDACILDMENAQEDLVIGEGSPVACVNSGQFNYDPTGHSFSVRITLYNQDGRSGKSITKIITFTP